MGHASRSDRSHRVWSVRDTSFTFSIYCGDRSRYHKRPYNNGCISDELCCRLLSRPPLSCECSFLGPNLFSRKEKSFRHLWLPTSISVILGRMHLSSSAQSSASTISCCWSRYPANPQRNRLCHRL